MLDIDNICYHAGEILEYIEDNSTGWDPIITKSKIQGVYDHFNCTVDIVCKEISEQDSNRTYAKTNCSDNGAIGASNGGGGKDALTGRGRGAVSGRGGVNDSDGSFIGAGSTGGQTGKVNHLDNRVRGGMVNGGIAEGVTGPQNGNSDGSGVNGNVAGADRHSDDDVVQTGNGRVNACCLCHYWLFKFIQYVFNRVVKDAKLVKRSMGAMKKVVVQRSHFPLKMLNMKQNS